MLLMSIVHKKDFVETREEEEEEEKKKQQQQNVKLFEK